MKGVWRLYRVELGRLASRRLVRSIVALLLLGFIVVGVIQAVTHNTDVEGHRREEAAEMRRGAEREYEELSRGCAAVPRNVPEEVCAEIADRDAFIDRRINDVMLGSDPRYVLANNGANDVKAAGVAVMIAAFLVGASFGGAEWAAGTMAALLFWEPRRIRVMLAKVAALATAAYAAGVAGGFLQLGISSVVASTRGTTAGLPDGFIGDVSVIALRGGALAVFSSLLAFGIAGLTRNTGAALGAAFVYFAIAENLVRGLRPRWSRFLIGEQVAAWLDGRVELITQSGAFEQARTFVLHRDRAGLTLAIYLVLVVGVMTAAFARRDVT